MRPEKKDFYRKATTNLLQQLDGMELSPADRLQAKKLTLLFRNAFSSYDVKMATFGPELDYDISAFTYDSDGFCKASSFAFMNAMNPADWHLMYIDHLWTFGPHHYLLHAPSGRVFDLTADQYTNMGIVVPYEMGRRVVLNVAESQISQRFVDALAEFSRV